jgi:hypothetical protein
MNEALSRVFKKIPKHNPNSFLTTSEHLCAMLLVRQVVILSMNLARFIASVTEAGESQVDAAAGRR